MVGAAILAVAVDTRNKPPAFEGPGQPRLTAHRTKRPPGRWQENTEALADDADDDADNVGNPLTATDPDPNMDVGLLIYTLSGADAGSSSE